MAKEILLPLLNCGLQSPPPFRKQIDQKLWKLVTNIVLSHYRFMRFRRKKNASWFAQRNGETGNGARVHIFCFEDFTSIAIKRSPQRKERKRSQENEGIKAALT